MDLQTRESLLLAPYAMHGVQTAGRQREEPMHAYRSPYQRDRDRILHSSAYRRLAYKTQVFTGELGDYHRTRLTHTLEVASVARTLARALRLNEDLVEALALAHDIGHPPFGHAGEDVLDERLEQHGGFNHNDQAVRIVTLLEQRYPGFRGLNLTREVLESQVRRARKPARSESGVSPSLAEQKADLATGLNDDDLHLSGRPLLEAQVVDAADSIAYDAHDADDALELGILELEELEPMPLWKEASRKVRNDFTNLNRNEHRRATVHELLDQQVGALLRTTQAAIAEHGIQSVADVRQAPLLVAFNAELSEKKAELEAFLFQRVYRHPLVLSHRMDACAALGEMFDRCVAAPEQLPEPYREFLDDSEPLGPGYSLPRVVADYLSSVTDRFALETHRRLCVAP